MFDSYSNLNYALMFGGISQAEIQKVKDDEMRRITSPLFQIEMMEQANAAIKRELSKPFAIADINTSLANIDIAGNATRAILDNPRSIAELIPHESILDTIINKFGYREALERIQEDHNRMMRLIALLNVVERKEAIPPLILPRIQSLTAWLSSLKAWIDLLIARTKHTEIFGIESIDTERKVIIAELF